MSTNNPFGDPGFPPNPYGPGGAYSYGTVPTHYRPHRGAIVLTLGILGLVLSTIGFAIIPCMPIIGLFLSIPAWVLSARDLKSIDRGEMDPQGRGVTMAGMITGIAGTAFGGIFTVIMLGILAFFVVAVVLAGTAPNMR